MNPHAWDVPLNAVLRPKILKYAALVSESES